MGPNREIPRNRRENVLNMTGRKKAKFDTIDPNSVGNPRLRPSR